MARGSFADYQSGRNYDFSPSQEYIRNTSTFGAGMELGNSVNLLYDQAAKTGYQPNAMLADSIILRANEKSEAIAAEARIRASEIARDATIESAERQAKDYKSAASSESNKAMIGSGIGTALTIGAALISDESTKNTVESIDNALKTLRDLKPVTFYYNEEYSSSPERLHYGFIAQEYQKVMPDATYYDESIGKLCINTSELIALLVRAIQQLEGRVTRMEAVNALTGVK